MGASGPIYGAYCLANGEWGVGKISRSPGTLGGMGAVSPFGGVPLVYTSNPNISPPARKPAGQAGLSASQVAGQSWGSHVACSPSAAGGGGWG